jgi:hypothetical protein
MSVRDRDSQNSLMAISNKHPNEDDYSKRTGGGPEPGCLLPTVYLTDGAA